MSDANALEQAKARSGTAALHLGRVVLAVAEVDGPDALTEVPAYPGIPSLAEYTRTAPRPLVGITAAMAIHHAARVEAVRYVRAAREAGHGWQDIGQALGLTDDAERADVSLAEAAHNWVVTGAADGEGPSRPRFSTSSGWSVTWRCPTCGGRVADLGPIEPNPVDSQRGHDRGCRRLHTDVVVYRALLRAEEGD